MRWLKRWSRFCSEFEANICATCASKNEPYLLLKINKFHPDPLLFWLFISKNMKEQKNFVFSRPISALLTRFSRLPPSFFYSQGTSEVDSLNPRSRRPLPLSLPFFPAFIAPSSDIQMTKRVKEFIILCLRELIISLIIYAKPLCRKTGIEKQRALESPQLVLFFFSKGYFQKNKQSV